MDATETDERKQSLMTHYVGDGSVSLSGEPVDRTRTGVWRAAPFIYVVIFADTVSVLGIAGNLALYASGTLHMSVAESANTVTNFMGFTYLLPIIWGFLADSYFRRFWIIAVASIACLSGLVLLTLSTSLSVLQPASCTISEETSVCPKASLWALSWFYVSLFLISVGSAGLKPCMLSMGQDQFDDTDPEEKPQGAQFFTYYYILLNLYSIFCVTVLFYIQSSVSFRWGYGTIAVIYFCGLSIFFMGTPYYRHREPTGSTITQAMQVFAAALKNRTKRLPANPNELYELDDEKANREGIRRVVHTPKLRCLDKAAIVTDEETHEPSGWELCPVTQVEDLKCVIQVIPFWICLILVFTLYAQVMGLGVQQANTLDRTFGSITIAPGNAVVSLMLAGLTFLYIYEKFLVPPLRKITGHPEGLSPLRKIGIALFLAVLAMVVGALVEDRRVRIIQEYSILEEEEIKVPMTILWLLPQFILLGFVEVLAGVALLHFFYRETPDNMRSLAVSLTFTTIAVGYFVSSALVSAVNSYSASSGGWLAGDFNKGGLTKYYYLLAAIVSLDLLIFLAFAHGYTYKKLHSSTESVEP
ncbi:unnamed protein product [Calypogeia fissa]